MSPSENQLPNLTTTPRSSAQSRISASRLMPVPNEKHPVERDVLLGRGMADLSVTGTAAPPEAIAA